MTDNLEEKIDKFKEDIIPIFEFIPNNFLRIRRNKIGGLGSNKYQTLIFIDNDDTNTSIKLGYYYDAKWHFENPYEASLFWQLIKRYHRGKKLLNIIYKMKNFDGLNDSSIGFKLRWQNRKRKLRRFFNKFKNK
jgi:hypothetical protein